MNRQRQRDLGTASRDFGRAIEQIAGGGTEPACEALRRLADLHPSPDELVAFLRDAAVDVQARTPMVQRESA